MFCILHAATTDNNFRLCCDVLLSVCSVVLRMQIQVTDSDPLMKKAGATFVTASWKPAGLIGAASPNLLTHPYSNLNRLRYLCGARLGCDFVNINKSFVEVSLEYTGVLGLGVLFNAESSFCCISSICSPFVPS